MSKLRLGAAGALLFVVLLAANAPARLLGYVVPDDQVLLQGLDGTVWNGTATRALLITGDGYLNLGRVDWTLQPLSLLLFSPSLDIDGEWGSQTLSGGVSLRGEGSIGLSDFEANLPAELLRRFLPAELAGSLSAQVEELLLVDWLPVRAAGRVVWQNATWLSVQGPMLLGSYALDFKQEKGQPLNGEVITISGPVLASGGIELNEDAYTLDVTIAGEQPLDPQLQQALALIAEPEDGTYRVQLQGSLPGVEGDD